MKINWEIDCTSIVQWVSVVYETCTCVITSTVEQCYHTYSGVGRHYCTLVVGVVVITWIRWRVHHWWEMRYMTCTCLCPKSEIMIIRWRYVKFYMCTTHADLHAHGKIIAQCHVHVQHSQLVQDIYREGLSSQLLHAQLTLIMSLPTTKTYN